MKEVKKYKLNLESIKSKEPNKIRLEPISRDEFDECQKKRYDIYDWDVSQTYSNNDLKK